MGGPGLVRPWATPRQAAPGNKKALGVFFLSSFILGGIKLGTLIP